MDHIGRRRLGHGVQLQCLQCGRSVIVLTRQQQSQFEAMHRVCATAMRPVNPRYHGLGDAVARVAQPIAHAIGVDPNCLPCQRRRRKLNGLLPRLWRRR